MLLGLKDKAVLVCASSAGLGKATALEFAREGARVMLASRDDKGLRQAADDIQRALGGSAAVQYHAADLTRADDIERLIAATAKAFGGVYTLVNNSGGPPAGSFEQFDDTAWQAAFELNLLSFVRTTRAVIPLMRKAGGGRIVNFASSSVKSPIENLVLSNTMRTGVLGLSKSLAGELGKDGILVNVLGPGRVQTARIEQLDTMRAQKAGTTVEQVRTDTSKGIPVGRYGTPEEFAKIAVFLGSPANTYITGQALLVDGGMVKAY
jgi:3-oxoacyl-[acyl-carrier protein] reductase